MQPGSEDINISRVEASSELKNGHRQIADALLQDALLQNVQSDMLWNPGRD